MRGSGSWRNWRLGVLIMSITDQQRFIQHLKSVSGFHLKNWKNAFLEENCQILLIILSLAVNSFEKIGNPFEKIGNSFEKIGKTIWKNGKNYQAFYENCYTKLLLLIKHELGLNCNTGIATIIIGSKFIWKNWKFIWKNWKNHWAF